MAEAAIGPVARHRELPLSLAQQRLWVSSQIDPSVSNHFITGLHLSGQLNREALREALDRVVARHEVLRTTFRSHGSEPVQAIGPPDIGFALMEQEVTGETCVEKIRQQEVCAPLDISSGPLIRGRLLRISDQEHVLLITQHRLISDDWSIGVLLREMSALYCAFVAGHGDPLPLPELQYVDYASWQRQQVTAAVLEDQIEFWKQSLSGATELVQLPVDRPRLLALPHTADHMQLGLPTELTKQLGELARRQGVSMFVTLLSAWAALLGRWSGQAELVIGARLANRRIQEIRGMIGAFENTVALRVQFPEDATMEQLLQQTREKVAKAYSHLDVPFQQLVEALKPVRSYGQVPQVMLRLSEGSAAIGPTTELQLTGLKLSGVPIESATTQSELSLSICEGAEGLTGTLEYASDIFERRTIEQMASCWKVLLEGMVTDIQKPVSQLPVLTMAERRRLLYGFNRTVIPSWKDRLMHELFEEQVQRRPSAVAVAYEVERLTYEELNSRANRLAHYLREHGVGPERLVGICMERSIDMVVGLLGILKAGGAYVPLDPHYPSKRLEHMLTDSAPVVVLTQERLKGIFSSSSVPVIAIDSDWIEISGRSEDNLGAGQPQNLAYVIYTSGSTGTPKGVMVEHRCVTRFLASTDEWFHLSDPGVWTLFHSFAFDFSVLEIWGALLYGSELVVVPYEVTRSPCEFYALLCRERITVLNQTPSAFRQLMSAQLQSAQSHALQAVILGGEALEVSSLRSWYERNAGCRPQITNMYGPTETTVFVTYRPIDPADTLRHMGGSPIGSPIAHSSIYVLDGHRQPVPVGVIGEIYVGGAGVARGYLNRPEMTAERFRPDPFSTDAQARMYKTGDLGRWRPDGTLEYLGRNDQQVKIRGFRIELGEIEWQLVRHPQVKEAVVIAREDVPGEKRLVAYVTRRAHGHPRVGDLRAHLKMALPEYMVPSAFVILESLPLSPNGKLDRSALPAPELGAYLSRQYEAPQRGGEEVLAGIWQELLRVEIVGRQDNFFELGGDSLLIVQMLERLRLVGLSTQVDSIFSSRSLADLAGALTSEGVGQFDVPQNLIPAKCELITPQMLPLVELEAEQIQRIIQAVPGGVANIQDVYPLTPAQEGMLFHHLLNVQGGDAYVISTVLALPSRERLQELIAALQGVINRHDVLRTAVLWEKLPEPVQVVCRHVTLPVDEIVLDQSHNPTEQIKEWLKPERQRMNFRQAPLMRLQVVADAHRRQWYAVLQVHHIVDDAVSLKILISEVVAHLDGRVKDLPAPVAYRNHVAQVLAHARTHNTEEFFRGKLREIDEPTTPFGMLEVHGVGTRIEEACEEVEPALAKRVRVQARRLGVSIATLFHAAWALVVARSSGRDDVVFGSVLLGRLQGSAGAQQVLGMFVNTLPLRLRLRGVTAGELVEQTQRELVELLGHEQASLAMAQRCSGIIGASSLFSAVLNYRHNVPDPKAEWESADGIRVLAFQYRTSYPITISVDDSGDGFSLTAQTDRRIAPQRIAGYLHAAMQSLVESLERAPQTPVLALSILPAKERNQIIGLFNATRATYPQKTLVHEIFEEQVQRSPGAIAVVFEGQSLTYAELNGTSNVFAHYLRSQGVQIGEYIPILMPRCLQMLIAQLAVLKCGGVYVPVDPQMPVERQTFMVRDCGARRILGEQGICAGLELDYIQWIDYSKIASAHDDFPKGNLGLQLEPRPGAYVMYTSGSTGVPKGVVVPHHAVNRLVINNGYAQIEPTDCIAHCSNPAFDASTFEVWGALLNGASVLIVPQSVVLEAKRFAEVLTQQRVTVLWLTVGLFAQYTEALASVFGQLRYLFTGGDVVEPGIVRRVLNNSPPQHLLSAYGPTECTTFSTTYLIESVDEDAKCIPIGKPIANTQIYILDRHLQPLPIGVAGEIYIGGAGVANGYLNRPELTTERFVADPFSLDPEARLYRSGDLGQWREDGNIEFLGRNDQQVKIRGFRIEPGEIDAHLLQHSCVKEAVVLVREDVPGEKQLVAYVVADVPQLRARQQHVNDFRQQFIPQLREYLKGRLPEYMIPSAWIVLKQLPLTPNGKLDRRALPRPQGRPEGMSEYIAPHTELERAIADIWAQLLRVDRVGVQDNFFELGGHSLLATRVITHIGHVLDIDLPLRVMFEKPTIEALSNCIVEEMAAELSMEAP